MMSWIIQKWFICMVQDWKECSPLKRCAIIGAGPAGCFCAYYAQNQAQVTLFDFSSPLKTLLYTGGGRCNLAHAEYDFKDLAKNYPRGEKFLYSIFSRFSTCDTLDFFEKIGVKTYVQDDGRIFPTSNSALEVRTNILKALSECEFVKTKVIGVHKKDDIFVVETSAGSYEFDSVVISIGGHAGFDLIEKTGHFVVEPRPALTGLMSEESFFELSGVSVKSVEAFACFEFEGVKKADRFCGDLLFTHRGISGPLVYQISSVFARCEFSKSNPLKIKFNFIQGDIDFQKMLNENSKKDVKNLLSEFVPKSLANYIVKKCCTSFDIKCFEVDAKIRDSILKNLLEFEVNVVKPAKDGEIVTSGGVFLDEINPKTMESKLYKGLYFCGEVIDVDGFCGGFNLQNCWSTGFVAGSSI